MGGWKKKPKGAAEGHLISISLCDIKLCRFLHLCCPREDMKWTVAAQKVERLTILFENANEWDVIDRVWKAFFRE